MFSLTADLRVATGERGDFPLSNRIIHNFLDNISHDGKMPERNFLSPKMRIFSKKFDNIPFFCAFSEGTPKILNAPSESSWKTASDHVKRSLIKRQELTQFIDERNATIAFSIVFIGTLEFLLGITYIWKDISIQRISDLKSACKTAPESLFSTEI